MLNICQESSAPARCIEFCDSIFLSQFWKYNSGISHSDELTIDTLDNIDCFGHSQIQCSYTPDTSSASDILKTPKESNLLEDMEYCWKDFSNSDDSVWTFNHNYFETRFKTIESTCHSSNTQDSQSVLGFFPSSSHYS